MNTAFIKILKIKNVNPFSKINLDVTAPASLLNTIGVFDSVKGNYPASIGSVDLESDLLLQEYSFPRFHFKNFWI